MTGIIFSIEEFAVFDGPGIRTTIFLKGCPLRCSWCHNPEGQHPNPQIVKSPNGCIGCGRCIKTAYIENQKAIYTDESIKSCPRSLIRYCGETYTANELCEKILKNIDMLQLGGVTFSGGEPLMQSQFIMECISILDNRLHIAIQTSGFCENDVFRTILDKADYFLYDLKIINNQTHIKYTGASNKNILENFKILTQSKKEYVVRIPLIPTVTDTEDNIENICKLLIQNNTYYAELLPYNTMAGGKYKMTGRQYQPGFDTTIECNPHTEIFDHYGIKTKIL